MDINIIRNLVYAGKISNLRCDRTNKLIFPSEPYYYIDGIILHPDYDKIDNTVRIISYTRYENFEEAVNNNDDDFYYYDNYDEETVIYDIIRNKYFYKFNGDMVGIEKKIKYEIPIQKKEG